MAQIAITLAAPTLVASDPGEKILIRAGKPYANAKASVTRLGGRVVHEFKYVDAIATEVPRSALPALKAVVGESAITKDEEVSAPRPIEVSVRKGGPPVIGDSNDRHRAAVQYLRAARVPADRRRAHLTGHHGH